MKQAVKRIGSWIICEDCILPLTNTMALTQIILFNGYGTRVSYSDGREFLTRSSINSIFDEMVKGVAVSLSLTAEQPTEQETE